MVEPSYRVLSTAIVGGSSGLNSFGEYVGSVINNLPLPAKNFTTIQSAIDTAIGGTAAQGVSQARAAGHSVYIPAGDHYITEPILIRSVDRLGIVLDPGARIIPTVSMSCVFDICGVSNFVLSGGAIHIPTGVAITTVVKVYTDTAVALSLTKRAHVHGMVFTVAGTGSFVEGFRFGIPGQLLQLDECHLAHCGVSGAFGISEYGVIIEGAWGNLLDINVIDNYVYNCNYAYTVYRAQGVNFIGNFADGGAPASGGGAAAFNITSTSTLIIGGRIEAYRRLLYNPVGYSAAGVCLALSVIFAANEMDAAGIVDWRMSGHLELSLLVTTPGALASIIIASPSTCSLGGVVSVWGDSNRPTTETLVSGANAVGSIRYIQASGSGEFVSNDLVAL